MRGHSAQQSRQRAVRGVAAVAGVAIAAAVVAGCASRNGLAARSDKSAGGAIQFAAAQVVTAKSVHVHGSISGDASATVDGSVAFAPTLKGELTITAGQNADMVPSHVLYDGTTFYAAIPKGYHATAKTKPNASWFALSATDVLPKNPTALAMLKSDPAALVKALLAKGEFTQAGTGTADGVAATHFTGDLAGDTAGHADVWLDASGLPVEIVFQSTDADKQTPGRTELHFSQWGTPVTITAPPADQILTDQDQISFAVSGQQFKISGDQLAGPTSAPSSAVFIGHAPSSDSTQPICIPITLPSSAVPDQPVPTSVCFTPSMPMHTR